MRSPTPPSCPQRRKPCPRIDGLAPRGALDPELLSGALVGTRSDAIKLLLCFLALGTDSNNFLLFVSPPVAMHACPGGGYPQALATVATSLRITLHQLIIRRA